MSVVMSFECSLSYGHEIFHIDDTLATIACGELGNLLRRLSSLSIWSLFNF